MAKILLVEDDNNLREIYEARLGAEGYEIVAAKDGEEALVVAKKERPDLVIADVMMPRISGFEMLDIMRNTEGLRDVRVIMLTALGQAEDKTRADQLGADRYLVKSQVTLEDIVKTASDLLAGAPANAAANAAAVEPVPQAAAAPQPAPSIPVAAPPTATASAPAPSPTTPPATPPPTIQMPPAASTPPTTPSGPPTLPSSPPPVVMPAPSIPVTSPPPTPATDQTPAPASQPSVPPTPPAPDPSQSTPTTDQTQSNAAQLADAVKDLISGTPGADATPEKPVETAAASPAQAPVATPPPAEPVTTPLASTTPPPPTPPTQNQTSSTDDVATPRKKIISPLAPDEASPRANLNELLAKEGISNLDDAPHLPTTSLMGGPQGSSTPSPAANPYSTPHPPGHVITPGASPSPTPPLPTSTPPSTTANPVDPNSISL